MPEEQVDFRRAQHHGKFFRHPHARQSFFRPRGIQSNPIQEAHRGDELVDRRGGVVLFIQQVKLVFADVFEVQMLRTELIKLCQSFNVVKVVALRLRREVA